MIIQATPSNYWISPTALHISLNALDNVDYIHANASGDASILVYIKDVIDYDNSHNYRKFQLSLSSTYFGSVDPKYIYVAIPRTLDTTIPSIIVFPSKQIDVYGKEIIINPDSSLSQGDQLGDEKYYYIFLQGIISASETASAVVNRTWTHEIETGILASDEASVAGSDNGWWLYNAATELVTFTKKIASAAINDLNIKNLIFGNGTIKSIADPASYKDTDNNSIATPNFVSFFGNKTYLSKLNDDVAAGKITFKKGLESIGLAIFKDGAQFGTFIKSLYSGTGAGVDEKGNGEFESIRVRSYFEAVEFIVNRLSAIEGDQLLTEADTIESVDDLGNGCYGLHLRSKWDGYFTAQAVNNVLKGIINTLSAGSGTYYTSWFRVNSVNTANNYIEVTQYPDVETPAGKNYPPSAMMKIARWGNPTDPTRQSCLYFSSTEGRIVKLTGVTKPIIDKTNYGAVLGTPPDFLKDLNLPLRDGRDYMYIPGIITTDMIRIDYQGAPVSEYVDRGAWSANGSYYHSTLNPVTGVYEISDVWYNGCKYRCQKTGTTTAPAWNNTDWAMVEGNPDFTVDFAETENIYDPDNFNAALTIVAMLYNIDITADILAADVAWTRYSEDASGVERVASDNAWALRRANSGKSITLTISDCDINGYMPKKIRFTATVTLRDGTGNAASVQSVSYEY